MNGKPHTGGNLKPLYAWIDAKPTHVADGIYFLRYETDKRVWEPCETQDPFLALDRKAERERWLREKARGVVAKEPEPTPVATRLRVADAIASYIETAKSLKMKKTWMGYECTLKQFCEWVPTEYVDSITRNTLIQFASESKRRGASDRTTSNRLTEVITWLRFHGVTNVSYRHKFIERSPQAYSQVELDALFSVCNEEQKLIWQFFLLTGLREQEAATAEYSDINFADGVIRITEKPQYGFTMKDKSERVVPLPDSLLDALRERRKVRQDDKLIFPNSRGGVEGHFLKKLKALAKKAGQDPERFWLHKFRASFATRLSESGVSVRTIQAWLGHSDLTSTLRYLQISDARSAKTREMVNAAFA